MHPCRQSSRRGVVLRDERLKPRAPLQIRNHFHPLLAMPQRQFHPFATGQFDHLAKLFERH